MQNQRITLGEDRDHNNLIMSNNDNNPRGTDFNKLNAEQIAMAIADIKQVDKSEFDQFKNQMGS